MGLGRLLTRNTTYTVSDSVTQQVAVYTVVDGIAPQYATIGNYGPGLALPGAWRASLLLSDLLGQVPWNAFREPPGGPEQIISPRPPLLQQPAPPETRMSTISSWALDLIWHGNAVGVIAARSPLGWPTAVIPVSANAVAVRRVTPYVDSPLPVGSIEYSIGTMRLGPSDVIHIKGPCEPGALRGMGVLETQLNTLTLAANLQKQASSISTAGVPTGVLTSDNPDLTEPEAQALKAGWLQSQATRSVAVLNSTTHFEPLSWNPEEMQLVEARKFSLAELELIFGLPVGWLGGTTSSRQYSNIEQDAVNLLKFSLNGHLARFEQTLSLAFPHDTEVRANLDAVLRSDTLTRFQAYAIALSNEFLTIDEVRELEHRGPIDATDEDQYATAERVARLAQQTYLAADVTMTADEIRDLLREAGATIRGPMPKPKPAPPSAPPPAIPPGVTLPALPVGGGQQVNGSRMNAQTGANQ